MNMKDIGDWLDEVGAIKNAEDLKGAVPYILEAQTYLQNLRQCQLRVSRKLQEVSDKCAKYAIEHPSVFDEGLKMSPIGVEAGDITINGDVYHLASGYSSPVRADGDVLNQAFLMELPKTWTKAEMRLDTTGIRREGVDAEELAKYGLVRPVKNTWSLLRAHEDMAD